MRKLACIAAVTAAVVLFASTLPLAQSAPAPKGTLVIVGGGEIPPEILAKALSLAGGRSASVAILPQASELAETGDKAIAMWKGAGAGKAVKINVAGRAAARRAIEDATLIWFPGGDQNRLMKALAGTGLPGLIRKRYMEGATVGGTSAGAAVLSKVMITGDADLLSIRAGRTKTADGLDLWPGVIVDQHFLKRQREARLISLVIDRPELVGVGIDESTAVIVAGRQFEVVGRSSVVVIDARAARIERTPDGSLGAGLDLRLHILRPGMRFDLGSSPSPAPGRR
jgi:cyanophycinase